MNNSNLPGGMLISDWRAGGDSTIMSRGINGYYGQLPTSKRRLTYANHKTTRNLPR